MDEVIGKLITYACTIILISFLTFAAFFNGRLFPEIPLILVFGYLTYLWRNNEDV